MRRRGKGRVNEEGERMRMKRECRKREKKIRGKME